MKCCKGSAVKKTHRTTFEKIFYKNVYKCCNCGKRMRLKQHWEFEVWYLNNRISNTRQIHNVHRITKYDSQKNILRSVLDEIERRVKLYVIRKFTRNQDKHDKKMVYKVFTSILIAKTQIL